MGLWPARANENPLDIRTYGHAMACPHNGRQSEIPRFARNDRLPAVLKYTVTASYPPSVSEQATHRFGRHRADSL